jgi:hypothetical protein
VNDVTDTTINSSTPYVTKGVWTTTTAGGGTAVIDMLTIPVVTANTSKTLTGVQLNDTNSWGSLQIDLAGLTVEFTPPAPQATCFRPGVSCTTPAAQNSQADKWQTPAAAAATDTDTKHANNGHKTQ